MAKKKLTYSERVRVKTESQARMYEMILFNRGYKLSEICTTRAYDKRGNYYREVYVVKNEARV